MGLLKPATENIDIEKYRDMQSQGENAECAEYIQQRRKVR